MSVTTTTTTGINTSTVEQSIKVNPNPSTGRLEVDLEKTQSAKCDIFISNAVGEAIESKTGMSITPVEVDLSNSPKGIYLLQIKTGDKIYTRKVLCK